MKCCLTNSRLLSLTLLHLLCLLKELVLNIIISTQRERCLSYTNILLVVRIPNSLQMDSLATNLELGCHPTSTMIGGPTPTLVKALTMPLEILISNLELYPISTNLLEPPAKFMEKQITMY